MRRIGGLLLVVALLSGCSLSDGAASKSAPLDRRWPPASTLTIEEPVLPPIDATPSRALARKYVSYLIDEIDYALRTTFPDGVLRRGTDYWGNRCKVCDEVVALADQAQAERRLYEFEDWGGYVLAFKELEPEQPGDPSTYWQLRLRLWQPEIQVLDGQGEVVDTMPARDRETVLEIGHLRGEWRIYWWESLDPAAAA